MFSDVQQLGNLARRVPGGHPILERARARAIQAADIVSAAVRVDPTLLDTDRSRTLDICAELLRQLRPLALQAASTLEDAHLTEAGAPRVAVARLGKISPVAPEELDALSEHVVTVAEQVATSALPDWNSPQRIRERSMRLLPEARHIRDLADQLADAAAPAAKLPHPAAAAIQLAALADELRNIAATLQ